jgi:hypothetical protein
MVAISAASVAIMTAQANERLDEKLDRLSRAVNLCLENDLREPALVLLYALVDAMAWLDRPEGKADVLREDFQRWAEAYVVPHLGAGINGTDLYGARCGLLHSHTAGSRLNRQGSARKILYERREDPGRISAPLGLNEAQDPAILIIESFAEAIWSGVAQFRRDLAADEGRWAIVRGRVLDSYFRDFEIWQRSPEEELRAVEEQVASLFPIPGRNWEA